jgi:hypothetical protein
MRAHQQAMHADQQQQGPVYFDQQNAQQCSPVYSSDNPSLHVRGSEPGAVPSCAAEDFETA